MQKLRSEEIHIFMVWNRERRLRGKPCIPKKNNLGSNLAERKMNSRWSTLDDTNLCHQL